MVRTEKISARIVSAIFAVAMIHASFCAAVCGFGVCPYQQPESASHDFDQPCSFHYPGGPHHHQGPEKSDCLAHHHATFNVVNVGGLAQFQQTSRAQTHVSDLPVDLSDAWQVRFGPSPSFDLGPPTPTNPLTLRNAVLRI